MLILEAGCEKNFQGGSRIKQAPCELAVEHLSSNQAALTNHKSHKNSLIFFKVVQKP